MKTILKKSCLVLAATMMLASCKKFDQINNNPFAANADQVQTEYFINNAIIGAQEEDGDTFSQGVFVDDWASEYYRQSSQWLNYINSAVQVGTDQISKGTA